jgi:hypothetical protein
MDWNVVFLTVMFLIIEGALAVFEGNFNKTGGTKFPFIYHGGIWGDLFLLPFLNGLIAPHIHLSGWLILALIGVAGIISGVMHALWYKTQDKTSWLWPSGACQGWWTDLSTAGILHVIFMTCELTILGAYILSPAPAQTAWIVAGLLTVFWPLGVIQPCWFLTGKWIDRQAILSSTAIVGATWAITIFKVY